MLEPSFNQGFSQWQANKDVISSQSQQLLPTLQSKLTPMLPSYQDYMLPLLKLLADGNEYQYRDMVEHMAREFNLSEEDRKEMLACGSQPVFDNRVGWAKTYLKKAGLLDSPRRATFVITELGRQTLASNPDRIDAKYLRQFPSFLEFQNASKTSTDSEEDESTDVDANQQTPEESLDKAHQRIRKALALELLNKVVELSPSFFERLVVELLVKMGYGGSIKDAGRALGRSGDEGIDAPSRRTSWGLTLSISRRSAGAPAMSSDDRNCKSSSGRWPVRALRKAFS
jgi:restriction system protein